MKALVLCGGYGKRLGALTRETPKPLLPIHGRPLLGYTLPYLATHGFTDVAINLHFQGEAIRAYCGDGAPFGVSIHYHWEQSLAGTAGTVRALRHFFGDDHFLVLYGDLLLDADLSAMWQYHLAQDADATLMLHQRKGSNSLVDRDDTGRLRAFIERPSEAVRQQYPFPYVNSGVQILGPRFWPWIPDTVPCDLARDVYPAAVSQGRLFGWLLSGYRCAIDSETRYLAAQAAVKSGEYRVAAGVKQPAPDS